MDNKPIYSNCKLLSIDGNLLSYIGVERRDWYLKKGLATKISDCEIQLHFKHRRNGNQPKLYTEIRKNVCVVCNGNKCLTRHHIVPYTFKKHFPDKYKNRTSFDVAALCERCHKIYESHANIFKKNLMAQYNIDESGRSLKLGIANTILKYKEQLPEDAYAKLISKLPPGVADSVESLTAFIETCGGKTISASELLVKSLPAIDDFIISWRKHFVQYAKPNYMPESWHEEIGYTYKE